MKTQILRVMTLGLAVSSLALCAGCAEDQAAAEVPTSTSLDPNDFVATPSPSLEVASAAEAAPTTPGTNSAPTASPLGPAIAKEGGPSNVASVATNAASGGTNAPAHAAQKLVLPENLRLSPHLVEVVKLAQAGVSEEVLLTYIINSTNVFNVGADEIVFLNDLGVSAAVITTLIQHDASPDTLARQQAAGSVKPLPPELALTTPATNVYPSQTPPPPVANYPETATAAPVYVNPPATSVAAEGEPQPTTVNYFYTSLAPYGNWVEVPEYGLCWQPTVAVASSYWRPYADNGRWYWTDCGWYWHSYYSWGWAPFHYGRWHCPPGLGWVWTPDTYWGPAWVTWRYTPYYCGWAPLPPGCHYVNGFGLYYGNSSVGIGFGFGFGYDSYTWIHTSYFCDPYPHHYFVASGHARTCYNQSTPINNYAFSNGRIINHGMGVDRIARVSRSEIRKVAVREEPMMARRSGRFERFEHDGDMPVLVRPRLPDKPPNVSALAPTKTASEIRNAAPPPAKRPSLETERQATALMSSPARNAAGGSVPSASAARPRSSSVEQTPASVRPPQRRNADSPGSSQASVVVTDGRNDDLAREAPSSPVPSSTRGNGRPGTTSSSRSAAATAPARNAGDPPGTIRIDRPTPAARPSPAYSGTPGSPNIAASSSRSTAATAPARSSGDPLGTVRIERPTPATRPSPARSGAPGSATFAAPATPAVPAPSTPSYAAPARRPSSPPAAVARNDASRPAASPRAESASPPVNRPSAPAVPSFSAPPSRSQFVPAPAPSAPVIRSAPVPTAPPRAASAPSSPPPASRAPAASSSGRRGNGS